MCEAEQVYLNSNEHARAVVEVETRDARFIRQTRERYPCINTIGSRRLMHPLRARKSEGEVAMIRQACTITDAGFQRVCRFVAPGVTEREVEAEFAHEFIRRDGRFAYLPIIASGQNNCVSPLPRERSSVPEGGPALARCGSELLLLQFRPHPDDPGERAFHAAATGGLRRGFARDA